MNKTIRRIIPARLLTSIGLARRAAAMLLALLTTATAWAQFKVGATDYSSFGDAVSAAESASQPVELTGNGSVDAPITISTSMEIHLNDPDHTLTTNGNLTISADVKIMGPGWVSGDITFSGGLLTLDNVGFADHVTGAKCNTQYGGKAIYGNDFESIFDMAKSGSIDNSEQANIELYDNVDLLQKIVCGSGADICIALGGGPYTISAHLTEESIEIESGGTLTLVGGTVSNDGGGVAILNNGTLTISGTVVINGGVTNNGTLNAAAFVVEGGNTTYYAEAWNLSLSGTATVTLLNDGTLYSTIYLSSDDDITFYLNGYTLSISSGSVFHIYEGGTLTIASGGCIGGDITGDGTVKIADGLYLSNGTEALSGTVSDKSKVGNKTLIAVKKITLPVNVTASGTSVYDLTNGTYAQSGTTATIAAAAGYTISDVKANGVDATDNGDGTYTVTVGTDDVTVTATVKKSLQHPDITITGLTDAQYVSGAEDNSTLEYQMVNTAKTDDFAIKDGEKTLELETDYDEVISLNGEPKSYKIDFNAGTITFYYTGIGNYCGTRTATVTIISNASVAVATEGYGTYYNGLFDATLPAGMKAYIVTEKGNGGSLTYEKIADGDGDGTTVLKTVPAATAVMLKVEAGTSGWALTLSKTDIDGRDFSTAGGNTDGWVNLLGGSDEAVMTTGGDVYYKLSYNASGENLGWYWGADGGAAFTSAAHKAWLALPASMPAPARGYFGLPGDGDDNTTGIADCKSAAHDSGIANSLEQEAWYSIDGRRLSGKPSAKGVYIHNGRKEVIR